MKNIFFLLSFTLLVMTNSCKTKQDMVRVLLFTEVGKTGWDHNTRYETFEMLNSFGKEHGIITTHAIKSNGYFTKKSLANYDVVVFSNTAHDVLDNGEKQAFKEYINNGGGFVGIHAASDTEHKWEWYGKLVGGYFYDHARVPDNVRKAKILVKDTTHEATKHLSSNYIHEDEWYSFRMKNDDIKVIMELDEKSYLKPNEVGQSEEPLAMGYHPISWYHEYDGGRAFYTGLGHDPKTFSEPIFYKHIIGGILFASGKNHP